MAEILEFPKCPDLYWLDNMMKKAGFVMIDSPYRTFEEHQRIMEAAKDNIRDVMFIEEIHFSYE